MFAKCISRLEDLEPYQTRWDELSGDCVFRSWAWLSTWWKHYGDRHHLSVMLVFEEGPGTASCQASRSCAEDTIDAGRLIGILPCYLESSFTKGRVVRMLGDGEICSDHLDVLADPDKADRVIGAIASYLVDTSDSWDATDFTAIGTDSTSLMQLSRELASQGCFVTCAANANRWSISLPDDWEGFLDMQSKSHRKKIRRLERNSLDTNEAIWHRVENESELEGAWPILTDLHQRRRNSLGEPGCFASERWSNFHREIASQLLSQGKLSLCWLEFAGQPLAAEYQFANETTTWAYQGGVDPDRIDMQPGRLSLILAIQHAIREGHQSFDLLRGDEPYKAQWRATPQKTVDICAVPPRSAAIWRNRACNCARSAVRAARQITNLLG